MVGSRTRRPGLHVVWDRGADAAPRFFLSNPAFSVVPRRRRIFCGPKPPSTLPGFPFQHFQILVVAVLLVMPRLALGNHRPGHRREKRESVHLRHRTPPAVITPLLDENVAVTDQFLETCCRGFTALLRPFRSIGAGEAERRGGEPGDDDESVPVRNLLDFIQVGVEPAEGDEEEAEPGEVEVFFSS
jgi:hypothetical protein